MIIINDCGANFVDFDNLFLDLSWKWLNDPEIKQLTNTPTLSKKKQKEWFCSLSSITGYYIKGIMIDNVPIGVCGLKHVTDIDGEYWGYIGNKSYWGKGIGKLMISFIEQYASQLGLQQIYLYALKTNERAINLYVHCGYTNIIEESQMIKMGKNL